MSEEINQLADAYCKQLDACHAEIERLEKEVDYHQQEYVTLSILFDKVVRNRDIAWNDAIEAAAKSASEWWSYLHDDQDRDGPVAAAIRAMKRPMP